MPPTPSTTVSRKFSQFSRSFWTTGPRTNFWKSSLRRCDRFRPSFVQIGAILAIFRPFEVFGVEFLRNFERPFTPRGWLRSARNFAKTRFRRFPTFDFSTPKKFFWWNFRSTKSQDESNITRFGGAVNFWALWARRPRKTTPDELNFSSVGLLAEL